MNLENMINKTKKNLKSLAYASVILAALAGGGEAKADTWTTLDMPGTSCVIPEDISGNNIVGYYRDASGVHGFLYNGTNWITLDMPGASETQPDGISGSNIIGRYNNGSVDHGFLYNGTNWTTLDMPGASETSPRGIDGNNIVGYYREEPNNYHDFLYNGTNWTTLLDFHGAWDISGINIVGGRMGAPGDQAFLYNGTSWTALDMPGARFINSDGIDGNNIVGYYEDASGFHGFLYTIPEPSTLSLLGLGGLALLTRKKQ